MNTVEILKALASELESSDNVALRSEDDEQALETVALACLQAAELFKKAAAEVETIKSASSGAAGGESFEHQQEGDESPFEFTAEQIDEMAALATEFDNSEDELLQKQASVLDAILTTISRPRGLKAAANAAEDKKIEALKKEYSKTKEKLDEMNKVSETIKAIEKSPAYKQYRPLEEGLSSRTCPDHPGELMARVGEHEYQCQLDKKIYNWETGFKTLKGNSVPGGSVDEQTKMQTETHQMFNTRDDRLNGNFSH